MKTRTFPTAGRAALAILVVSTGVPLAAHAQSQNAPVSVADPTVHEIFSRDLDNQCEYRAEIRGTMRPTAVPGSHADGTYEDDAPRFEARLRVRPELHCPGVAAVRGPVREVHGPALSAEEITRALSQRSVLHTGRGVQGCSYEPRFVMDGAHLAGRDVRYSCPAGAQRAEARGGGIKSVPALPTVSVFDDEE